MSRYFLELSYCGTKFNGWQSQQKQQNSRCVQQVLEDCLHTLTRQSHDLIGCGRTDTGVHAIKYMAHTDSEMDLADVAFVYLLNKILPEDIVIHDIFKVNENAHARFDATSRSYSYYLHLTKTAFPVLSYHYFFKRPQIEMLNEAASMLLGFSDFNTFCKSKTDIKTTECKLKQALWLQHDEDHFEFQITADRFLRGMVRLIVGMCLDVDRGKLRLTDVQKAMENRSRLPRDWSVPAIGLFLKDIEYPFLKK